jgi:phenylpropionate dioxygenase-like ring-hydroxylating dioxygenase large terminal subunit
MSMIRNQWYAVLESNQVKKNKPVGVTRLGEKMVFWRTANGELSCLIDQCPHRGCALRIGKIMGDHLQCPFHGFEFDSSGRCTLIPASGKNAPIPKAMQVRAYPVREAHNFIWVWWGDPQPDYPPLPFFDDLGNGFSYATYRDHWPVHYSRAIENQLDAFHLPFVHATTIGRGLGTIIDGPQTRLDGEKMDIWVHYRKDDGSVALKQDQLPESKGIPLLKFIFPNIWMNRLSEDFRIVVAFVPVDEGNTLMYVRYYQRFIRLPILRDLVNLVTALSSTVILNQDKRVVITQQPIKTELKMGEKVISQDRPIVLYRAHRRELIDKSS